MDNHSNPKELTALERAAYALKQMRSRLQAIERNQTEGIAVIGMGCRYPGGVDNPESLWRLLRHGVDAVIEIPPERWDIEAYYDPDPERSGKMYTRYGGFLRQVDEFDPQFFGISPRETVRMDPQHRLFLEVSWEALEHAGQDVSRLKGSATGVFLGIGQNDYAQLQMTAGDMERINAYDGTGNGFCFASGRLSYILGLQGPNMAIDTACSSSLVAIHLACQSLRAQECDLAIAGGVQLMLSPEITIFLSRAQALSPDGRCKAFDASANGFNRGEGCGVVVLKRLSDALAQRDNVLAIIRGSAVNHDGHSSGLTVPNELAQEKLMCQALKNARLNPGQVQYIEAHGTGTALGDPIEVGALGAVFGGDRPKEHPLIIGSIKTNLGHLEAAAGIAGFMKVVLSLQHEEIPPHLHFKEPNPHIPWHSLAVKVPTTVLPWPRKNDRPRIAGVSSFGMSGTNAHVVLEEPPLDMAGTPSSFVRPIHVLTLSARSDKALMELSKNYAVILSDSAASLQDVCFTANTGRFPFAHRLAVVGGSTNEICEKLTAFAKGDHAQGVFGGLAVKGSLRIVFLFTGQGSQYVGMGRQLYDTQPTFRETLEQCDEILRPYLDESLLEVLYPELEQHQASRVSLLLDQTMYTQPALFSLEYALAMLWKSWGIWPPAIVMGHSVGEYVAACIAGLFSLEDGLKLVAQRGRLIQQHLTQQGQMAVVFTPYKNLTETIKPYSHDVSIAAINGHKNTVISGTSHAVLSVLNQLKAQGIKCMTLPVSHAFHSPLVEPILEQFRQFATEVAYHIPKIDIISNVTGGQVKHEMMNHEYWCRHMREPVRFAESMQLLYQDGYRVFVEIGPSPVLLGMGRGCMPENIGQDKETPFQWLPTLRQGRQDWQQLLESLAQLYLCGASVDWAAFDENYPRKRVVLPTYPFERQRYWVEPVYVKSQDVLASTQDTAFWLDKVDIKRLIQLMEKTGRFSKEQLELVEIIAEHEEAWNVGDLLYQIAWPSRPRRQKIRHVFDKIKIEAGQWLILADKGGMGEAVATLLTQHGQTCLIAYAGHSYESLGNYHWQARPARRADFERLFQEVSKHQELPLRGVIHLWGLDALKAEDLTLSSVAMGCGSLVYLVQCLTEHNGSAARLWLGTRGAVAVGESGETLSLPQTPLWGLGKVIVLEHPEHWGGMIDLDPKSSPEDGLYFLTEVLDSEGEDFLALRHGQRYVPRLVRTNLPVVQGQGIRHDGTYLITGGLGFLGLKIAQWMIQQGCQHIVLTGRHVACTKETQDAVHQMEQKAEVRLIQADVSVKQDMARVFEEIKTHMPPLRGIIHAAGMGKYQNIKDMDQQSIEAVLRAKVTGAWIVHELSSQMNLDFFLCLSSIASVWGSKGQGHYAAANHFLDTLAHYRHKLGLPGLTVNLGPFLDGGMTSTDDLTLLKHMGVKALPSKQSIEALGYLLDTDCIQMTMAKVDWSILKGLFEVRKKHLFFESIDGTHQQKPEVQKTGQGSEILQKLKAAPIKEQPEILIHYLQGEVASILELGLSSLPDIDQGLFEMGMDSLMVVELKNRLETALETTLPSTLAFDYPNINSLARYLWKKVPAEEQPKEVSGETQQSNTSYEELSLDEVEAAITEKVLALENLLKNSY